jgi:hypothetical protein
MNPDYALDLFRLMAVMFGAVGGLLGFALAALIGTEAARRFGWKDQPPVRAYYDPPAPPLRATGDRAVSAQVATAQRRLWAVGAAGRAVAALRGETEDLWSLALDQIAAAKRSPGRQRMMVLAGMAAPGGGEAATNAEPELRAADEAAQAAVIAADQAMAAAIAQPAPVAGADPTPEWIAAETALARANADATAAVARARAAAAGIPRPDHVRMIIVLAVVMAIFAGMLAYDWVYLISPRLNHP